jgi:hypothetical protein
MSAIFVLIDTCGAWIDALVIAAMVAALTAWIARRGMGRR